MDNEPSETVVILGDKSGMRLVYQIQFLMSVSGVWLLSLSTVRVWQSCSQVFSM
jgi:hypothetical protein